MSFHKTVACVLMVLLAISPAMAKQRQESPEVWRAFTEKLEAGAFVRVTLKDHKSVKGHFVMIENDAIRLRPKTRIPVPIRTLNFADIASIDRQREGWSPGAKVLAGVATGLAIVFIAALSVLANLD